MKALIFGAGQTGEQVYTNIKDRYNIIGFLDGNIEKHGLSIMGVPILGGVEMLPLLEYDKIFIGTMFWKNVWDSLVDVGVKENKIVVELPDDITSPVRNLWLKCYANLHKDEKYSVAEGGVYRGSFAAVINQCFPNSKLYLFDTFSGFDERDVALERAKCYSEAEPHAFDNTSIELVMSKMVYADKVEIHQGFFPESACGIEDKFMFVNLDFDLYQPILEGLRFFYPKMVKGSVILIHDYYHTGLMGVKEAIKQYEREIGVKIVKIPIGDNQSIALIA